MGWLLFESLLAFVILIAIVAWTMAPLRKRRPPDRAQEDPRAPTSGDHHRSRRKTNAR